MAERLLDYDVDLVVYNRTIARAEALVLRGATVAADPADLAGRVDVVVTCLLGPDADRAVYEGPGGLLSAPVDGKIFINTATVGPQAAARLGSRVEAAGADYLDAPMLGGGPPTARNGTLMLPVGATATALDRARPVLELLANRIEHLGPVGSAQVVKLVNNLLVGVHSAALAEALRIALAAGADPAGLMRILPQASSHSRVMDLHLSAMLTGPHAGRGTLKTLGKDVRLAVEMAQLQNTPTALGETALANFQRAMIADGLDVAALIDAPAELSTAR
jgi:3-hydroxyisobutyrate dehydrogenase-like beta-hydroxyacid dehydrogenase